MAKQVGSRLKRKAGQSQNNDRERGRQATQPSEIPRHGWWDILVRVKNQVSEDHVSIVAAGVALYGFLAVFPALAALVSIYGLLMDPGSVQSQMQSLETLMPSSAANVINNELQRVFQQDRGILGWTAAGSVLIAFWSASKAIKALFDSMNIAYDEDEERGFLKLNAIALLLTLGAILFVVVFLALTVGVPALLANISFGGVLGQVLDLARWPFLAVTVMVGLALLYRYGPSRANVRWRWVSWGAAVATVIWLVGSYLFSLYVSHFGNYTATYGSLGAVVILITWFVLGAYAILLGAEVNAEMEHQTARDTTTEKPRPMGDRGAYVADTVGPPDKETGRSDGRNM
jgi:membrane protein